MIEAQGINKAYGNASAKFSVLKDISLRIPVGAFTVLLGASGSGKSTLLHLLSGLEHADSGTITYFGTTELSALSDAERTAFRRENIGFVFQQYYLLPNLTVERNVRMGADLSGNRNYLEILDAVGLSQKRKRYPYELSGGEQQRVSIARALAKQPKVLFLDEPTGALDEETGRQILDYLEQLHRELHFCMVMVTHNQNIAEMADTVLKMNSGKIVSIEQNSARKSAYEIGW